MDVQRHLFLRRCFAYICCLLLCFITATTVYAQKVSVKGTVVDTNGDAIIGASVKVLKKSSVGTITDLDGNFTLSVPEDATKLEISFVGMKSVVATVKPGKHLKVVLEEDNQTLDEVVVVGYGTSRRGDLTGAISSVSEKVLKDIPITSAAAAITGKLAGVNVVATDGSPDATIQITVRGGGSITQDNSPLYIVDGFQVSNINDIPPGDIQSIDVLKDASSTAIYGAKGANGVILVTTKSGKAGKTEISFNAHWGVSNVYNLTGVLSPYEYYCYQKELDPGTSLTSSINSMYGRWDDRNIYRSVEGTNWQDKVYGNTGFKQSYNVGITGGTDATLRYNLSYTRDDEKYIMLNSNYVRDNLSVKMDKKLSNKLKFEFSSRLTRMVIDGAGTNGGKLRDAVLFSPINSLASIDAGDALGGEIDYSDDALLSSLNDPVYNTVNEYKKQNQFSMTYNAGFNWEIVKGLTYQLKGSYAYTYNYTDNVWLKKTGESSSNAGQPVAKRTDEKGARWNLQNILSYRFSLKKNHRLDLMAGHEMVSNYRNQMIASSKYYPMDFTASEVLAMWNYGESQPTYTTLGEPSRTASYFGRLNYAFKDRYMFTFTARADGTNVFAPENRWGFFPGMALAWRISQEKFMKQTEDWLDNLKLRVSYGSVGNARVNSYWRQDYKMESSANRQYYLNETVQAHRLDLMAGHEMVSNYRNQMIASSKYYPMDFTASEVLAMWNYGESQPTYTTLGEPSRTASYFGRLNYAFKDRYMFTFTARADGTNVFAPENRWGFFPGMALAWRISQEKFMKQTEDWLDNLKLRVSYGSVGNARVNSYWRQDYKMESSANRQYYLNETVQSALKLQNTLRNENLTWETKLSSNVGIDASLFNSRLNVTVDFYNDITKDLILRMDLPSNSGYEYQYQNVGRSTNRGVELTLSGTIINSKDFYLGANFNISFNKNIVNKLDGTATVLSAQSNWRPDIGSDDFRAIVGQAVGQIYGFEVEGFYSVDDFTFDENTKKWILNEGVVDDRALFSNDLPNFGPGFIKLKDQNNDGVIDADNDRKVIGSVQPKHIGGFGLNAAWRGFDLAAMFNWSYGNKVYNANKIMASTHTNRKYNNIRDFMSLENRWSIIDPETGANVMYGNDANPERFVEINSKASIWMPMMGRTLVTDWAIEDGSFLRCSNLTLGYTLPVTVTRKLGVKNLRVYATANNLFCWTAYSGQDPEVSTQRSTPLTPGVDYSAYPKAHSYVFGLNVTF